MEGILVLGKEEKNMRDLTDLKNRLYDILLCTSNGKGDEKDVSVNQQLGVSISKAMQRDGGINILQFQSAHIHNITEKVIEALKVVDMLNLPLENENLAVIDVSPAQIEHVPDVEEDEADLIEAFCNLLYRKHMNWKDMQEYCKQEYSMFVRDKQPSVKDGAEFLGLNKAYFGRLTGGKSDDQRAGA
jgi:hypothetical protein